MFYPLEDPGKYADGNPLKIRPYIVGSDLCTVHMSQSPKNGGVSFGEPFAFVITHSFFNTLQQFKIAMEHGWTWPVSMETYWPLKIMKDGHVPWCSMMFHDVPCLYVELPWMTYMAIFQKTPRSDIIRQHIFIEIYCSLQWRPSTFSSLWSWPWGSSRMAFTLSETEGTTWGPRWYVLHNL